MKKIIRLTESDLVRIIGHLINEQPQKWVGQNLVRPALNLVRGIKGRQISKTAKLGQEITKLKNIEKKYWEERNLLWNKWRITKEINWEQCSIEISKLDKKYNIEEVRKGIYNRRNQLNVEKNKTVVTNTPQENIIKSRYEAIRGKDISQGGFFNEGIFDLGNGYIAKVSKMGWKDPGIQNLKWKDKIKSPRVMKTVEVKSFIDSQGKEIVYQVQEKGTGKPFSDMKRKELINIPKIHRTNFIDDVRELYRNNVFIDANPQNFLYDPNKGIQFVDLGRNPNIKGGMATPILNPWDLIDKVWPKIDVYPKTPKSKLTESDLVRIIGKVINEQGFKLWELGLVDESFVHEDKSIDQILDKIGMGGMGSLSSKERRTLYGSGIKTKDTPDDYPHSLMVIPFYNPQTPLSNQNVGSKVRQQHIEKLLSRYNIPSKVSYGFLGLGLGFVYYVNLKLSEHLQDVKTILEKKGYTVYSNERSDQGVPPSVEDKIKKYEKSRPDIVFEKKHNFDLSMRQELQRVSKLLSMNKISNYFMDGIGENMIGLTFEINPQERKTPEDLIRVLEKSGYEIIENNYMKNHS
jgi:hypothetical protein